MHRILLLVVPAMCLSACTAQEAATPRSVSLEVDTVRPTLLHLSWSTDESVRSEVVTTVDDDPAVTTVVSPTPSTSHDVDLYPLPAGTTVDVILRDLDADGVEVGSSALSIDIPDAPSDVPTVTEIQFPDAPPTPYLLIATAGIGNGQGGAMVVDWHGRPVWWTPQAPGPAGYARPRADGGGIFMPTSLLPEGATLFGAVASIDWDGTTTLWPAPVVHHDVIELPDGRVGVAGSVTQEVDGEVISGEQVMIVGPDGPEDVVWNSFDHYPVVRNSCWDLMQMPDAKDWVHANGLDYDGATDTWLVSLYCQQSVLAIDGATGETVWGAGGEFGDLTLVGDPGFGPQHAPRWVDGGFEVFDNGMDPQHGSRVATFTVDAAAGTATYRSEWRPPDGSYTGVLGESNDYGDGQLVSVGFDGGVFWHDADGRLLGELQVENANAVGSVQGISALPL